MDTPKLFVATKAFIVHDGKVLILRESGAYADGTNQNKFDLPGGRLNPGERFDEALTREVQEETGLEIDVLRPITVGEWRPTVRGEPWQVVAIFFECTMRETKEVHLSGDHDEYRWVDPKSYLEQPIIDNLKPVFEKYTNG